MKKYEHEMIIASWHFCDTKQISNKQLIKYFSNENQQTKKCLKKKLANAEKYLLLSSLYKCQ